MSEPGFALRPGVPVLLSLQAPKEKIWGLLLSVDPAGVSLRGLDLAAFDDWVRQEARGEEALIGLTTLFYPMHRLERLEMDETVGPLVSYADRFVREVGRPPLEGLPRGDAEILSQKP